MKDGKHVHAPLIHCIFKLCTHTPSSTITTAINIDKELKHYEKSLRANTSKTVIRHKSTLLKTEKLNELQMKEADRLQVYNTYYQDSSTKLFKVHLHLIIELVSSNYVFIRPALSYLFRIFWGMDGGCYKEDVEIHSK